MAELTAKNVPVLFRRRTSATAHWPAHLSFPAHIGIGAQVERAAREQGLIVRNMGDSIALAPPFIITAEEIALLVARLTLVAAIGR